MYRNLGRCAGRPCKIDGARRPTSNWCGTRGFQWGACVASAFEDLIPAVTSAGLSPVVWSSTPEDCRSRGFTADPTSGESHPASSETEPDGTRLRAESGDRAFFRACSGHRAGSGNRATRCATRAAPVCTSTPPSVSVCLPGCARAPISRCASPSLRALCAHSGMQQHDTHPPAPGTRGAHAGCGPGSVGTPTLCR